VGEQLFGVEAHSVSGDPLFMNFEKGDLRLRPESPAWKLGFQPMTIFEIGLRPAHPFWRRGK